MSTHPNTVLLCTLKPEGLARATMKSILAEFHLKDPEDNVRIGSEAYTHTVMESDYDECYQISSKEGDLLFFTLVTYGYGEQILWENLDAQKSELEKWAKGVWERHHCSYQISVTANYW